jgi:hypothetical protein
VKAVAGHGDTAEITQFVAVATGAQTVEGSSYSAANLGEAYRCHKTVVAGGEGQTPWRPVGSPPMPQAWRRGHSPTGGSQQTSS